MSNRFRILPAALFLFLPTWVLAAAKSPEDFLKGGTVLAAASAPQAAAPKAGKPAQPAMDTVKVHEQYLEGDFDQAIRSLDSHLKSKRPMSHQESVFVYKHLGVMYAAQQSTRDKGKFYMSELINIEPTAKILDMYASDMIHLIFRNVQEEFEVKRARLAPAPDTAAVAQAPAPSAPSPAPIAETKQPPRNKRNFYLAAAGAGVAVGAFTLFMVLSSDEPETRTIHVTE